MLGSCFHAQVVPAGRARMAHPPQVKLGCVTGGCLGSTWKLLECILNNTWLVVWNMNGLFFHIWGILIPTDELILFRGVGQPPTSEEGRAVTDQICWIDRMTFMSHVWLKLHRPLSKRWLDGMAHFRLVPCCSHPKTTPAEHLRLGMLRMWIATQLPVFICYFHQSTPKKYLGCLWIFDVHLQISIILSWHVWSGEDVHGTEKGWHHPWRCRSWMHRITVLWIVSKSHISRWYPYFNGSGMQFMVHGWAPGLQFGKLVVSSESQLTTVHPKELYSLPSTLVIGVSYWPT